VGVAEKSKSDFHENRNISGELLFFVVVFLLSFTSNMLRFDLVITGWITAMKLLYIEHG